MKTTLPPISIFVAALSAAFVLVVEPVRAESDHNLVLLRPPPSNAVYFQPEFLDLASARRDGEVVTIDQMEVFRNYQQTTNPSSKSPALVGVVMHVKLSCAWWTSSALSAETDRYDSDGNFKKGVGGWGLLTDILDANSPYVPYLDKTCAGEKLYNANGFASLQAAMAWSEKYIVPVGQTLITTGPARREPATEAAWMMNERPHQFIQVSVPDPGGASLYLDFANLKRAGADATGLSLLVLGAEDQRKGYGVVALRRVAYDCAHPSLTIEAQVRWDRYGDYFGRSEAAFKTRPASDSAAAAAEVSAACSMVKPRLGPTFTSVFDAWADARNRWPPRPDGPWKVSCIWQGISSDARNSMTAAIEKSPGVPAWKFANNPPTNLNIAKEGLSAILDSCKVPKWQMGVALLQLYHYAYRQTALEYLRANQGLTEGQLSQVWRGLEWRDREKVIKVQTMLSAEGRAAADSIIASAAASLGITTADGRQMFDNFVESEAWFEA